MIKSQGLIHIAEPMLTFGHGQNAENPKEGLLLYGPYKNPFAGGRLRIGLVSTKEGAARYMRYVHRLSLSIPPAKSGDPNHSLFPGFQAAFEAEWPAVPAAVRIIDGAELGRALRMGEHHQAIYRAVSIYADEIVGYLHEESETSIDIWMAVIPEDVYRLGRPNSKVGKGERISSGALMNKALATRLLKTPSLFEEDNSAADIYLFDPDFHNQLKARLLPHKASIQVLRETTLAPEDFQKSNGMPLRMLQDKATLAWNLSSSCFFKAGGQPWRLASPRPGVCYVGIVFKKDFSTPEPNSACCGAQMFLGTGEGVVFRGAVGPWLAKGKDDFHLSREKARELMAMVVDSYRREHKGESPRELFIHGKTRFSAEEWEAFRETVPQECNVACIRIRNDPGLKLFRLGVTNLPRGLAWVQSDRLAKLWTKGFIPKIQTYPGREVPNPLSIEICRGQADIRQVLADVMALTKLNYNACIFADGEPVTLRFADSVGEILTAAPKSEFLPPLPFRFYI